MRLLALFPLLCATIALALSFLCVFAGSKPHVLEHYDILTLNISRIGQNVFNTSTASPSPSSSSSSNPLTSFLHNITSTVSNLTATIENDIKSDLNHALSSLAKEFGLHDFYSAHILTYCDGYYTLSNSSKQHRNVTYCSNSTAFFTFRPTVTLERELEKFDNKTGLNITLADLHWPEKIEDGLRSLRRGLHVMFVLYCIGIIFTFLSLLGSAAGVILTSAGVISALANVALALLAFLTLGIASAIVTGAAVKGSDVINRYGGDIGVSARRGNGFLSMTWAAVGLMMLAAVVWMGEFVVGRRRGAKTVKPYKHEHEVSSF